MARLAIVPASPRWPTEFALVAAELGRVLGAVALRIDHVGSTSVPGLDAKDVIDVQVAVGGLADLAPASEDLARAGYRVTFPARDHPVPGQPTDEVAWIKLFAAEPVGARRVHVHVRVAGAPNHRYALLFRDYLRRHPDTAKAYEVFKRRAAHLLVDDAATYADLKDPVCDLIFLPALTWAEQTSWTVPAPPG